MATLVLEVVGEEGAGSGCQASAGAGVRPLLAALPQRHLQLLPLPLTGLQECVAPPAPCMALSADVWCQCRRQS